MNLFNNVKGKYYEDTDLLYLQFRDIEDGEIKHTIADGLGLEDLPSFPEPLDNCNFDISRKDGKIVSIEILNASQTVPQNIIDLVGELPNP